MAADNLCISISEDTLKLALLKGKGSGARVQSLLARDIAGLSEAELITLIKSSIKEIKVKSADIYVLVPPGMITTKNIEIPSTSNDEIQSIVELQATRHTPFTREEIKIGYTNIGVYKNNFSKVLLVIANRNKLKHQLTLLDNIGLKVKKVLFAPEVLGLYSSGARQIKKSKKPVGLIDISMNSSNIMILKKGTLLSYRHIPVGKSHFFQDKQAANEKLIDELNKTLEAYQADDIDILPEQYSLVCNEPLGSELKELMTSQLGWKVETTSVSRMAKVSKKMQKQLDSVYANNSLFDVIAGGTMGPMARLDLTPDEILLQKSIAAQGKEVFVSAVFFILILVGILGIFGVRLYFLNAYLNKMKQEYSDTRNQVIELEGKSAKVEIIDKFLDKRMASLDLINEIYQKITNEMYLTRISLENDGTVTIEGISEVTHLVHNLITKLKSSEFFESVEMVSSTSKKERGINVQAFEVTMMINGFGEGEEDFSDN